MGRHHVHPAMITSAVGADCHAVVALWEVSGLIRPWNDPHRDFAQALSGPSSTVLVARDGDALVGSVMAGFDGHRGWAYYLAVAPNSRRKGLGRALMEAAESWLRAQGAVKVQLMVRNGNDAIGFYEALGLERQDVVVLGRFLEPRSG